MSITQADNGAGWEYVGPVAEVAAMAAGRVGVAAVSYTHLTLPTSDLV